MNTHMGNDIQLQLPDTLFLKHRLCREGPLIFRLDEKFRQSLLLSTPYTVAPLLPASASFALREVKVLVDYYGKLLAIRPGCLQADKLMEVADRLIMLARQSPDGAVAAILLCPCENYVVHHAINTALLASVMADSLKLSTATHRMLMLAALTMNLGAIALHNEMAHQEGPPSTMQRQLIEIHPLVSSALLREAGIEDERQHLVILTHHERNNGRGYPFKLKSGKTDPLAQLLHLLDITIAKLMPRSYRPRLAPHKVLAQLYTNPGEPFDLGYLTQLVKVLGVYPSGSFVSLNSGEIALVVAQSDRVHEPRVATLRGGDNLLDTAAPGQRITKSISLPVEGRFYSKLAPFWSLS